PGSTGPMVLRRRPRKRSSGPRSPLVLADFLQKLPQHRKRSLILRSVGGFLRTDDVLERSNWYLEFSDPNVIGPLGQLGVTGDSGRLERKIEIAESSGEVQNVNSAQEGRLMRECHADGGIGSPNLSVEFPQSCGKPCQVLWSFLRADVYIHCRQRRP